jgi:retron-type reverse transcriptase
MKVYHNLYSSIISLENLFESWQEFRRGKRQKLDVQIFERNLENNLFSLHKELKGKTYRHGNYTSFYITDPKLRHIHKACVKDRVLHHAVYRVLYPIFDHGFIFDSYSCRIGKGTHKAVSRLEKFNRRVSKNYSDPCFALRGDIKKFFDSVDQNILLRLVKKKVKDSDALWLISEIIKSFKWSDPPKGQTLAEEEGKELLIGNLTSQFLANIYLDKLDQFIKHKLKVKGYLRYCDDFLILDSDEEYLSNLVEKIDNFLQVNLKLALNKEKMIIRKLKQGIDFLGYVGLPHHRILRTKTKRRMFKRINQDNLVSYLGLMKYCNSYKIEKILRKCLI